MPTTNTNFSTLITAIDTKAQSLAASTTDPKDLVFLGKAVEALNLASTVSDVIAEGDTQIAAVQAEGTTQVAAVAAQGANYAPLSGATFTGAVTIPDLTVTGTTTTINSTNLNVADANITIADGAANSAAADGAGITIDGADVNFQYSDTGKYMSLNKTLQLDQAIMERVKYTTSGQSTVSTDINNIGTGRGAIVFDLTNATANRTLNINMAGTDTIDSVMAQGDAMTVVVGVKNGSTAYYLNAFEIEGSAGQITVTPLWQGGSAPTGGNPDSHDIYTFTVIKQATNQFQVLASMTQFA